MKFKEFLNEMATDSEKNIAMKTSASGAVGGDKAITPKVVRQIATKEDKILDFGAGKTAYHTRSLRKDGFNVTAHDFTTTEYNDPKALSKRYDIVFASNVLNVQDSTKMLINDTLKPIHNILKKGGKFIANFPSSPLKGAYSNMTYSEAKSFIEGKLKKEFISVDRRNVSGTPVFICIK